MGSIGTGLLAGLNASLLIQHKEPVALPVTTMLGALCYYVTNTSYKDFQPMKANFGLLPPLADGRRRGKKERGKTYAERSAEDLNRFLEKMDQ